MECKHQRKRAVLPRTGGDGKPILGMPPQREDEPAWCIICGALWADTIYGWGWQHPMMDREAPTVVNALLKEHLNEDSN